MAKKKLTGHASIYRSKPRVPKAVLLTRPGHVLLAEELARTGMSQSDYFEGLMRKEKQRLGTKRVSDSLKPGEFVPIAGVDEGGDRG